MLHRDVPQTIYNKNKKVMYTRGPLLGKGGFGKCYELSSSINNQIFAGKVVSKSILKNQSNQKKMIQEVSIHRTLNHPNIVKFIDYFEDDLNVYIILEVCSRRSMSELLRRRNYLTMIETRYFTYHISLALKYLHELYIMHRDLKLGNVFLTENMKVKLGDFGLSTKVIDGVPKRTMCGTPNYIAPEILNKRGHSFKVDSWSLGCLVYTMLVGRPPFDTEHIESTYKRIQMNQFSIPKSESSARTLILNLLQTDPSTRYSVKQTLESSFLNGFFPMELPVTCLTTPPHFDRKDEVFNPTGDVEFICGNDMLREIRDVKGTLLSDLKRQLDEVLANYPSETSPNEEDAEDPACLPVYFVSKWIDYSDLYGFGYELSDGSIGIQFNDNTLIICHADGVSVQYIDSDANEKFFDIGQIQPDLVKKVSILKHFIRYMSLKLVKTGAGLCSTSVIPGARMPYLLDRFRTKSYVVFSLSNGIVQVNFMDTHEKIILCPLVGGITFIDGNKEIHSYKFQLIVRFGCSHVLKEKLNIACRVVDKLISRISVK